MLGLEHRASGRSNDRPRCLRMNLMRYASARLRSLHCVRCCDCSILRYAMKCLVMKCLHYVLWMLRVMNCCVMKNPGYETKCLEMKILRYATKCLVMKILRCEMSCRVLMNLRYETNCLSKCCLHRVMKMSHVSNLHYGMLNRD
jgi:hypothetical protein